MKTIRSVLVVDDNPADVEIATHYLSASGRYQHVFSASDGQEALELFSDYESSRSRYPDMFPPLLVILDINMPRLSGFEFLDAYNALGEKPRDPISVVMLTSSEFDKDIAQAAEHQLVRRYLVKPFTRDHAEELADAFGEPH